jgi:DNA-binding CsgD family transcriptional regulator
MPAHAVDIRGDGVLELLLDTRSMAIWELLRRIQTPSTAAELSNWTRVPTTTIQASLDRLGRFGLVDSVRAGGRRKSVAYRVTQDRIVLAGTPRDPGDRALLKRFYEDRQEAFDRVFGSGTAFERSWHPHELFEFLCAPVSLNEIEVEELRRRLDGVLHFLKLVQAKHNGVRMKPPPRCNYYVTVRVQPLSTGVLPQPDITVAPRGQVPPARAPEPGGWRSLSAREREVAIALMGGSTQPEIARKLGRSPHTIGTLTRRIYRKLRIRRRAELVNVLRIIDGPAVA